MAEPGSSSTPAPDAPGERVSPLPAGMPFATVLLAWLVPGLGHAVLRRWARGLLFLGLILVTLAIGCALEGNLHRPIPGQPLTRLATLGALGMGVPYFVLRWGMGYEGNVMSAGYEYGTAFILTAGLMNWLLILDAFDIARGKKE